MLSRISIKPPLVECLTNTVTMNDVANTILAVGASPVMGMELEEVSEFVHISSAVLLNIGTITKDQIASFEKALQVANELGKPVVLDPVGVGATTFRTRLVQDLLTRYHCTVIRGNASELKTLANGIGGTSGVDAAEGDIIDDNTLGNWSNVISRLASKYSCVVAASGKIDIISDGTRCIACRNGVEWLEKVTGTGCSLGGLTAVFAALSSPEEMLDSTALATAMMGSAGELAYAQNCGKGIASFHTSLLDCLSMMDDESLRKMAKLTEL